VVCFTVRPAIADDRVVFGGSVEIDEDEVIEGDLVVFGGSATIAGRVTGDAVVFGGRVVLEESGVVEGDLATMGGSIVREGTVKGSVTSLGPPSAPEIDHIVADALEDAEDAQEEALEDALEVSATVEHADRPSGKGKFGKKVRAFLLYCHIAYMSLIAILILLEFNPDRILNITRTVEIQPGRSLLAGALSMTAFGLAFLLFLISVVGIPIALLVPFVLGLVGFPGVMGMSGVIARKLPLGRISGSTGAWLIGVALMTVLPLITYKFIGIFLFVVLYSLGLGAAILSRFGRREPAL